MPQAWFLSAMPAPDIPLASRPWRQQRTLDDPEFKVCGAACGGGGGRVPCGGGLGGGAGGQRAGTTVGRGLQLHRQPGGALSQYVHLTVIGHICVVGYPWRVASTCTASLSHLLPPHRLLSRRLS